MQASPRLGLHLPEGTDQFTRQQFLDNFGWLDDAPGIFPCTSTTHPTTWGDNQIGRCIIEIDTGLILRFNDSHAFEAVHAVDPASAVNAAAITALTNLHNALQTEVTQTPDTFIRGVNTNKVLASGQTYTANFSAFTNPRAGTYYFWTVCDFVLPTPIGTGKQVYVKTELFIDGTDATGTYGDPYIEDGSYTVSGATISPWGNTRRQVVGIGFRGFNASASHSVSLKVSQLGGSNSSVTVDHIRVFGMYGAG